MSSMSAVIVVVVDEVRCLSESSIEVSDPRRELGVGGTEGM